jgi:hypothetical protein
MKSTSAFLSCPPADIISTSDTTFIRLFHAVDDEAVAGALSHAIVEVLESSNVKMVTVLAALHLPKLQEGKVYTYSVKHHGATSTNTFGSLKESILDASTPINCILGSSLIYNLALSPSIETMLVATPGYKPAALNTNSKNMADESRLLTLRTLGSTAALISGLSFDMNGCQDCPWIENDASLLERVNRSANMMYL